MLGLRLGLMLRNKRMASRLCHCVFLQPILLCLHKASKGTAAIETTLGFWPPFDFAGRDTPGTAKSLCCAVATSAFSQVGPGSPVFFAEFASATTPSYASRVGCHWLRHAPPPPPPQPPTMPPGASLDLSSASRQSPSFSSVISSSSSSF